MKRGVGKSAERRQKCLARLKIASAMKAIGSGTRRSRDGKGRGGSRDMSSRSHSPATPVLGFMYEDGGIACRDPPKCKSRNSRSTKSPSISTVQASVVKRPRPGRPIVWKRMKRHGRSVYIITERTFKATEKKDRHHAMKIKELKARIRALQKQVDAAEGKKLKVPKRLKATVASILQAKGVSGSNVPEVIAIVSKYLLGYTRPEHLMAPSTALDYVRDVGEVLRNRSLELVGSKRLGFFIAHDGSNRGGDIGSNVISYLHEGKPIRKFFCFERMEEKTAKAIASAIIQIADSFMAKGGTFLGISSDAPNVMVGVHGGVGVLLSQHYGRYIRHDRCHHHASACVLRVLESMWPAQMNVESVTQLSYLCWYILNVDWDTYEKFLIDAMKDDKDEAIQEMLGRFEGGLDEAIKKLRKPVKPSGSRWRTLSDMIVFVYRYREALRRAFDKKRVDAGVGASTPGSEAAMCTQWIKWASSPKLCALLNVAREFIQDFWNQHDKRIQEVDLLYGNPDCFGVYFRPLRSLRFVMDSDARVKDLLDGNVPQSFDVLVTAFGNSNSFACKGLLQRLYKRARNAVYRNYGPYLQGALVLAGVGDPDFVFILWEALSYLNDHDAKPKDRTPEGTVLESWLRKQELDRFENEYFKSMTSVVQLNRLKKLVDLLEEKGRDAFVEHVKNPPSNNPFLDIVRSWAPALSHTQDVERTFLAWDQMNVNSMGRNLKKATAATGKRLRQELINGRVLTREMLGEASSRVRVKQNLQDAFNAAEEEGHESEDRGSADEDLEEQKKDGKRKKLARLRAKRDIIAAVDFAYEDMQVTDQELLQAREVTRKRQKYLQKPHMGIAQEMLDVWELLDRCVEGWEAPQKQLSELIVEGECLDITLETTCSGNCLKTGENNRGRPSLTVKCSDCERNFHVICMQEEGVLDKHKKFTDKIISSLKIVCPDCRFDHGSPEMGSDDGSIEGNVAFVETQPQELTANATQGRKRTNQKKRTNPQSKSGKKK